jgi:DnaK suppressor protein
MTKTSETLTASQLDVIRRLLDDREKTLQAEVRAAVETSSERTAALGTEVGDAVDIGDDRFHEGMAHVDKQRDQEELMAIDAARERMRHGRYGECVDCGQPIPFERLKAQPSALRCVVDQGRYEKTHPAAPLFSV